MPIQYKWFDEEQSRIYIRFDKDWTSDQFQFMVVRVREMVHSKEHLVDVIADFTNSSTPSSTMLVNIPFAVSQIQANQGVAIVLTQSEIVRHLANTAASMHHSLRKRVYVVESLTVAERILSHHEKQRRAVT